MTIYAIEVNGKRGADVFANLAFAERRAATTRIMNPRWSVEIVEVA